MNRASPASTVVLKRLALLAAVLATPLSLAVATPAQGKAKRVHVHSGGTAGCPGHRGRAVAIFRPRVDTWLQP